MPRTMPGTPENMSRLADQMRLAEEDRRLLDGISAGKEESLALLYDEYAPLVVALAMKMTRSISDAEAIVQEVFQDLWRNASSVEGVAFSWIMWATRERALVRLRARGHRKQHHAFDPDSVLP